MLVARARPVLPEGGAIYTDFTPNVQKVLLGQSTPTQGMNAVAAGVEDEALPHLHDQEVGR